MYTALWQTQLLHKNNSVSFGAFGIVLVLCFVRTNKSLHLFGCCVVKSIFLSLNAF